MNNTEIKNISVSRLVERLGGRYAYCDAKGDLWYYSPFRPDEEQPSFKVDTKRNSWHDFSMSKTFAHKNQGSGGDIADLWCDYHFKDRRECRNEAVLALKTTFKNTQSSNTVALLNNKSSDEVAQRYKITDLDGRVKSQVLKDDLIKKRISLQTANRYLQQGQIKDNLEGKTHLGFILRNDQDGYEGCIPGSANKADINVRIGAKASTRFMASDEKKSADVFLSSWDFLSWLEIKGNPTDINHTYILTSLTHISEVCSNIIAFSDLIKFAFVFMENNEAGYQATHTIAENLCEGNIKVGSFEQFYSGSTSLSRFWMNGLKPDVS